MKFLTILVDLDAICADMLKKLLQIHNEEQDDNIAMSDVVTFNLDNLVTEERKGVFRKVFTRPGFYTDLEPIPGAIKTVAKWRRQGHRVVFLSSPPSPHGAAEKYIWVNEHFGPHGFTIRDVMLGSQKDLVHADVLVDDYFKNARGFKAACPFGHAITIGYPYCKTDRDDWDLVAGSYASSKLAWEFMDAYVQELSRRK